MKYGTYLYMRKSYRAALKRAQLTLGKRHYELHKTATGSVGEILNDPEPKYGIRDTNAEDFRLRLEVDVYTKMLQNLELEAAYGFEYERPGGSLVNSLLPRPVEDQKDIRRSEFNRYTRYPRKTAIAVAISLVILGIASLLAFPFLSYISLTGAFLKTNAFSSFSTSATWQGALGTFFIVFCLYIMYNTIKNRSKKLQWRISSMLLKRYFLGTRSLHLGRKIQTVAVFSVLSIWNLWWAPWFIPGRAILATLMMVIDQKRFAKTDNETESFVAAWRFGSMFIFTVQICLCTIGVLAGVIFIVA